MSGPDAVSQVSLDVAPRTDAKLARAGERAADTLSRAIEQGFPAGGTIVVTDSTGELVRITGGWACLVGERIPTSAQTLYDIASLTKVVSTVTLALELAQRDMWTLDDPVTKWLTGFPNDEITLRALLTHTSGLPPHREFYRLADGPSEIRRQVYAEAEAPLTPGIVAYSDLGYMLLGWALAECGKLPLDQLFTTLVAEPLQMTSTRYVPPPELQRQTAATELDGDQRLTPGLVWGVVHDGNAWALGGIAGHAGVFAPADDLASFVRALLKPADHPVLSSASLVEMTRFQIGEPPDVRALGWRLDASDWGPWPAQTYWHTGFTGTSLLVSPESDLAVVALLGGVHPERQTEQLISLRRAIHRELAAALT
jgi:CubicO group peptidase (beta-lactamase class C family)